MKWDLDQSDFTMGGVIMSRRNKNQPNDNVLLSCHRFFFESTLLGSILTWLGFIWHINIKKTLHNLAVHLYKAGFWTNVILKWAGPPCSVLHLSTAILFGTASFYCVTSAQDILTFKDVCILIFKDAARRRGRTDGFCM